MAKKRVLDVQPFGLLTHRVGDLWESRVDLSFLGRKWSVPLFVDIPKHGGDPEPQQVEAYNTFQKNTRRILRSGEAAIVNLYRSMKGDTVISSQDEVSKAVKLVGVTFPYARTRATFGFLFTCDWDEEHGLAIKFEDGELAEVGPQDIVL